MDCNMAVENDVSAEDVQAVRDGLVAFNLGFAPDMKHQQLRVMLRARDGSPLGGLLGETWWEWLHVNMSTYCGFTKMPVGNATASGCRWQSWRPYGVGATMPSSTP